MGLVPKCSEKYSTVSSQESGVMGQGSGVRTGVKYRDFFVLAFFSRFDQLVTPVLTPDP